VKKHGGFYLGSSVARGAARAGEHPEGRSAEYPNLGWRGDLEDQVEDFPAFILVDDKGNDFFQQIACGG